MLRSSLLLLASLLGIYMVRDASAQDLRFAWLTDTHVGSTTGSDDLRRSVRDINHQVDVRFVILSGDITEFGSDAQLREAKAILDSLQVPYHIIPGNHDTKWSASGGTTFRALWGNDRFVFDAGGYRFIGIHQGPRMKMADGYWAPEDLRWLDSVLTSLPDPRTPLFLVTHYPVDSSIANWYELLDRVRPFNIQAFLVGHGHRKGADLYEGIPGIMNRSNLRGGDSVGGYALCRFAKETLFVAERRTGLVTLPPWDTLFLGDRDYGPVLSRASRPDTSVNRQYPAVRRVWSFDCAYTIASSAGVDSSSVVVGDASGRVTCLNLRDGTKRWVFNSAGPVYSTPVLDAGRVFFGSADSSVWCLEERSGKELWRFKTGAAVVASPAIVGGRLFIGASDGQFRCLDPGTGRLIWSRGDIPGFVECRPLVEGGRVLFGAWDGHFYALDEKTGDSLWMWAGDRPGVLYSPGACWPVGRAGRVFFVAPDRKMTCLEEATGREMWRTGMHEVRESIGMSADGRRLYVRTVRDTILALDPSSPEPVTMWANRIGFGYDINSAMLVEQGEMVYYPTKNGFLYALDAHSGELIWVHRLSDGAVHTVSPAGRRRVVATGFDGRVTLLESR
jgi:outer membrane protein assembly factor BamB/predicted phosphodiesterase